MNNSSRRQSNTLQALLPLSHSHTQYWKPWCWRRIYKTQETRWREWKQLHIGCNHCTRLFSVFALLPRRFEKKYVGCICVNVPVHTWERGLSLARVAPPRWFSHRRTGISLQTGDDDHEANKEKPPPWVRRPVTWSLHAVEGMKHDQSHAHKNEEELALEIGQYKIAEVVFEVRPASSISVTN